MSYHMAKNSAPGLFNLILPLWIKIARRFDDRFQPEIIKARFDIEVAPIMGLRTVSKLTQSGLVADRGVHTKFE